MVIPSESFLMLPLKILSTGKALPSRLVTAEAIDEQFNFVPGFTLSKSGVRTRHFAPNDTNLSDLAAEALNSALANGRFHKSSIDLLISASGVQEQALPSTACAISAAAGLREGLPAFDVGASCISFMVALRVAAGLLNTGGFNRIAVVSADLASRGLDWDEPEASLIFGDGAACAILEKGDGSTGIESFLLETFTEGRTFCEIRAGGTRLPPSRSFDPKDFLFRMNGKAVFKLASQKMPGHLAALMAETGCTLDDIDVVVPHQASHLGMKHVTKKLGLPLERIVDIYATHGNQVAASIPTALHEAFITGKAGSGKRILLIGTAAGLSIGSMLLKL